MPLWQPELIVGPALAADLITGQFPQLSPVSLRMIGAGWDNTAYLVNGSLVFRCPRRAIAAPLIEIEIQVLPWLATRVPLPIPVPAIGAGRQRSLNGRSQGTRSSRDAC